MPTVTFCNELNDNKIGYPSYVPRATHRFTFDLLKKVSFNWRLSEKFSRGKRGVQIKTGSNVEIRSQRKAEV